MSINNEIYNTLGERWYTAFDDPVALLRAEAKLKNPWILEKIRHSFDAQSCKVLDIGCGAGFLTNALAQANHQVTGLDLSQESLAIARIYDATKNVQYQTGDAYSLPFQDASFDVVCAMDFLEHVEDPERVVKEVSRVLRPGGLFFFHTFNRNPIAWLVIIKAVEWFVKNTPRHMHVLKLFIKPKELKHFCESSDLEVHEMIGTKPNLFNRSVLKALFIRTVPKDFSFRFTPSLMLSYTGIAKKRWLR